ncbi:Rhodanese-like domain-containing protein [Tribonema minus]|uniref:Rhodanese-like domain-containing protein n=1 Tax=Tribonema minus TaxID=303371 RepID=A0A836CIX1_9STRA|nr:Rhodanese-like domain-containing protein [Tribonema minus]
MRKLAAACLLETAYGVRFTERCGLIGAYTSSDTAAACTIVEAHPVFTSPVVGVHELKYALDHVPERVRVVDSTWHGAAHPLRGKKEFKSMHVPSSTYFSIEDIANKTTPLPRMLPKADVFSKQVSDLGIGNEHHVVIYGGPNTASSARVWWMFRVFGHERVHILQGGLQVQVREYHTWTSTHHASSARHAAAPIAPLPNKNALPLQSRTWRSGSAPGTIVDVRPPERFHGLQAEPPLPDGLPEPARGHIPTSINLPWQSVVSAENSQHFLAAPQLSEVFRKAGVDVASDQPIVTTCSSGITAAMVSFALHLYGRDPALNPVFDGSWAEWATSSDFPIVPAASQARPPQSSRTDNAQ